MPHAGSERRSGTGPAGVPTALWVGSVRAGRATLRCVRARSKNSSSFRTISRNVREASAAASPNARAYLAPIVAVTV